MTAIYSDPPSGLTFLFQKFRQNPKFVHCVGTSCHTVSGGWLRFWEYTVGEKSQNCSFEVCENEADVGAHVRYSGSIEKFASWYIVPACRSCNGRHGKAAKLRKNTKLVKVVKRKPFASPKLLIGDISENSDEYEKMYGKYSVKVWPKKRFLSWGWKN